MPKKQNVTGNYFGADQEKAVRDYILATSQIERTRIYNKYLRDALDTMCESLIKRYKLQRPNMTLEEIQIDALNDLMLKADKFKADNNTKAYSYYGTILKRYLIGKSIEHDKYTKKYESFDDLYESFEENEDFQYEIDEDKKDIDDIINLVVKGIQDELSNTSDRPLTENEIKLGSTLIDIINNREFIIKAMGVGNKYNKIAILEVLRNYSGLSTKDIRIAMKRFKSLYDLAKLN